MTDQEPRRPGPAELRSLFLFETLSEAQLTWLAERGHAETFAPGPVALEGDPAQWLYVLLEGTVVMSVRVGDDDVEVSRTSQRGVYGGAWQAYLGDRVPQLYRGSLHVTEPSTFFMLAAGDFSEFMHHWFPMPVHILQGLFFGTADERRTIDHRGRLLALGSLAAGLAHELNNPAAAASRAAGSLQERTARTRGYLGSLAAALPDPRSLAGLIGLQEEAVSHAAKASVLSPMQQADREDELGEWLTGRGAPDGWELAPVLVSADLDTGWLARIAAEVPAACVPDTIRWFAAALDVEALTKEMADAASRISVLVGAVKQYAQLDLAPLQQVNVNELIDSTLLIFGGKIGDAITIVREFDPALPRIDAYAAELNQVWSNLIDNALYAMSGAGTLTLRTRPSEDRVVVEVIDTGAGLPAGLGDRIFEPFFTTKPVGAGTGLGLDISWRIVINRHHGQLTAVSGAGRTTFRVVLPVRLPRDDTPPGQPRAS